MAYSQAFTLAVTVCVYIAVKMQYKNNTQYLATKYIADKLNIPVPTLNKIVKNLVISRLILSKEGAKGGLILAKNPKEITLYDIFKAIENERPLFKPINLINLNHVEVEFYKGKINNSLLDAEKSMKDVLSSITIQQLVE